MSGSCSVCWRSGQNNYRPSPKQDRIPTPTLESFSLQMWTKHWPFGHLICCLPDWTCPVCFLGLPLAGSSCMQAQGLSSLQNHMSQLLIIKTSFYINLSMALILLLWRTLTEAAFTHDSLLHPDIFNSTVSFALRSTCLQDLLVVLK